MSQTRRQSLLEAWTNIAVGLGVSWLTNVAIFPLFGWHISLRQNALLGVIYTVISLARSYTLRRLFNRWHTAPVSAPRLQLEAAIETAVEFNERLFREGKVGRFIVTPWSRQLVEHPTIMCTFSRPLGDGPTLCHQSHGLRRAVWRRDMGIPYCASCVVEDPYE